MTVSTIPLTVIDPDNPFAEGDLVDDLRTWLREQDIPTTPAPAADMGGETILIDLAHQIIQHKDLYIALASFGTAIVTYLSHRQKAKADQPNERPMVIVVTKDAPVTLTDSQATNESLLRDLLLDADTTIEVRSSSES